MGFMKKLFGDYSSRELKSILRSPVDHLAGIGTYFVETGLDRQFEFEIAISLSLVVETQQFALNEGAIVLEQLHVEHTAQGSWQERRSAHHISFEIDGFILEIGIVIEVQIHFFTRILMVKFGCCLEIAKQLFHILILLSISELREQEYSEKNKDSHSLWSK